MSRLAKKPIVQGKAEVSFVGDTLTVHGPKGTLTKRVHPVIAITVLPEGVSVTAKNNSRLAKALIGTYASHVRNMVKGVETPYKKVLILEGVGYKVEVKGKDLQFAVGFSHPVKLPIPADVTVAAEKNVITLESSNKESVGQFAANVQRVKPPEPYLGKGIRYEGEIIRRKQGKKAV
ncbi:MAG: 50S ribosomal protein L6 [bacterium]|nr:50S ribosomal protein L6 [bacterium]